MRKIVIFVILAFVATLSVSAEGAAKEERSGGKSGGDSLEVNRADSVEGKRVDSLERKAPVLELLEPQSAVPPSYDEQLDTAKISSIEESFEQFREMGFTTADVIDFLYMTYIREIEKIDDQESLMEAKLNETEFLAKVRRAESTSDEYSQEERASKALEAAKLEQQAVELRKEFDAKVRENDRFVKQLDRDHKEAVRIIKRKY